MQRCPQTCASRALFRSLRKSAIRSRSCFTSPSMRCCLDSRRAMSCSAWLHEPNTIASAACNHIEAVTRHHPVRNYALCCADSWCSGPPAPNDCHVDAPGAIARPEMPAKVVHHHDGQQHATVLHNVAGRDMHCHGAPLSPTMALCCSSPRIFAVPTRPACTPHRSHSNLVRHKHRPCMWQTSNLRHHDHDVLQ